MKLLGNSTSPLCTSRALRWLQWDTETTTLVATYTSRSTVWLWSFSAWLYSPWCRAECRQSRLRKLKSCSLKRSQTIFSSTWRRLTESFPRLRSLQTCTKLAWNRWSSPTSSLYTMHSTTKISSSSRCPLGWRTKCSRLAWLQSSKQWGTSSRTRSTTRKLIEDSWGRLFVLFTAACMSLVRPLLRKANLWMLSTSFSLATLNSWAPTKS
jgi:hypothetical protein